MNYVQTITELQANLTVLDTYLDRKTDPEYSFAIGLIKRGTCFVAIKRGSGYRFYPSRFIGYADNTMEKHLNNEYKDGRKTTPAISKLLQQTNKTDSILDHEYELYCEALGLIARERGAFGAERKFWMLAE